MTYSPSIQAALDGTITELTILFDGKPVKTGTYVSRKVAAPEPTFSMSGVDTSKTYTITIVDLDAPFISAPLLSPILHYLLPNVTASADGSLSSTTNPLAGYTPPAPPPGAAPHRYVSLLYEQPEGFNADESVSSKEGLSVLSRIRLDYEGLERKAKFEKPVAGSYFTSN